ncbi:MAG: PVC-type heme-binding CxxCH protein [Thalassotalea sp.]
MRILQVTLTLTFALLSNQLTANDKYIEDAQTRMKAFAIPDQLKAELWADQSQTQNPSFFSFDGKGRMLITELDRINRGVGDVRSFSKAKLIDDIYIQTSADRLAMYKKYAADKPLSHYTQSSDQIRLVADTNGDGRADQSNIFATGFNDALDGLGVGVIERDGKVLYTNIPNLWQLEDTNNDGVADKRESLQSGFGTRVSFMGHDMHGLVWGPDGRLYWSLGDRGYSFTSKEGKTFHAPNEGAIFRANADGSNIEVFYTGVRNPQELVFDEYGNLFTADNDGDQSDTERVNHLIEGGDSGWHAGHQTIMSFTKKLQLRSYQYTGDAGVPVSWLVNDMSVPRKNNQPAYMLPGIGQLLTGPSGFTYNPSNYLGEQYRNSFFVALYAGSSAGSYISSFKTEENGASFLMTDFTRFSSGINAPDVDFGPDGRLYVSEFNYGGWDSRNEGAIFAISPKNESAKTRVRNQRFQQLLTADYSQKTFRELTDLLAIDHQKIRQNAQFELAKRDTKGLQIFQKLALDKTQTTFSRIHSIWGLSQFVFETPVSVDILKSLLPLVHDQNEQVRIQTVKVLGDHNASFARQALLSALTDKHPQVKMNAAIALGRIGEISAVAPVVQAIIDNGDQDLWLRHAYVMALKGIDKKYWFAHKDHLSKSVRLAVLLALRALSDQEVAYFLHDKERALVEEAIVAITDKALINKRGESAKLLNANLPAANDVQAYFHHRLINANYNEGQLADAKRILAYATHQQLPNRLVAEALAAIEGWDEVNPIDTITGLPTTANKNRADITTAVHQYLPIIISNAKGSALVQAMRIADKYHYQLPSQSLMAIANDVATDEDIRVQSLKMLATRKDIDLADISVNLLTDDSKKVLANSLGLLIESDKKLALTTLKQFLASTSLKQNIAALTQVNKVDDADINQILVRYLTDLLADKLAPQLTIELLEATEQHKNAEIQALVSQYQNKLQSQDLMGQYAATLTGGDLKTGREIFHGGGAAQCIRCHRVNNFGQSYVGPDLTGLASRYDDAYILQALIEPSAAVAPGFGVVSLTLNNGEKISGQFKAETEQDITLTHKGNKHSVYQKDKIKDLQRPMSGMPPMNYILTKREIRDLLAYLTSLKNPEQRSGH